MYHHTRDFEHVLYGSVRQVKLTHLIQEPQCKSLGVSCWAWPLGSQENEWHEHRLEWEPAYSWLEERVGFYPLFLSVGSHEDDLRVSGYNANWRRWVRRSSSGTVLRQSGTYPNRVLFSWETPPHPQLVFTDYLDWHIVLNSVECNREHHQSHMLPVSPYHQRMIFKPSYKPSDWLRKAHRQPASVQAVVPELDLRSATRVWCRNKKVRQALIDMGWDSSVVEVRRISVD